jgi:GTP-binding protein
VIHVLESSFITTATSPEGYPPPGPAEFAFAGRSNVGKSSLINALSGRRKLVRVSRTPGRTRTLNFFSIDLRDGETTHQVRFCDLPGYGFAKVSKTERKSWEAMIETYLRERAGLRGVVLIVDGEVGPTPDDAQTLQWLAAQRRPVVVVATKIDRLSKARRFPALQTAARFLALSPEAISCVSSIEKLGLNELWLRLLGLEAS